MTDIVQHDMAARSHEESSGVILSRMVANDQAQHRALASRLSDDGPKKKSKATRMRFVVCFLGLLSLTMSSMYRVVINYTITSMVDPRILKTSSHSVSSGGSCPIKDSAHDTQVTSLLNEPEVAGLDDVGLIGLITTEHSEPHHIISNDSLTIEKIYKSRSSQESSMYADDDALAEPIEDRFMWTIQQQGLIKGGFFYSYFFFMIPGGRLAEIYGAKYVILIAIAGSGIISLATPWMARNSFSLLVASRVVMGIIQSPSCPAYYALLNKWLTMGEKSIFAPLLKTTIRVGQMLASMGPGLVPDWPYVYYWFGLIGAIWSILWIILATSDPDTNRWVSEAELMHIMKEKRKKKEDALNDNEAPRSFKTPWLAIITSASVIALVLGKFTFGFVNYWLVIELPSYLRYVYHASQQEMSFITTIMFAIQVPLTIAAGWLAKYMVQKHPFGLTTTTIRKIFQSLAIFGCGTLMIFMTFSDCSLLFTGITLQFVSVFAVFVAGGEVMLPFDLSDEYPATISAIANSVCNAASIIVTTLTSLVLGDEGGNQSRWNTVILLVASANMFGGLIFCLLVKAEYIDFDKKSKQKSFEDAESGSPKMDHLSKLASQSKKADELMMGVNGDHQSTYRSNSDQN